LAFTGTQPSNSPTANSPNAKHDKQLAIELLLASTGGCCDGRVEPLLNHNGGNQVVPNASEARVSCAMASLSSTGILYHLSGLVTCWTFKI
jgi:hypothetical protein